MTTRPDLTRWNRSGLQKFRYVEGNAVTYLETLRAAMKTAFTESGTLRWSDLEAPVDESERERYTRLLEQYRQPRQDHAWEMLRTLARSTHVLTEHLDAFANESFLGTATQWENVRRLVEMIDYHPAPPASASTYLALIAKKDEAGLVEAGFAVKNKPTDGSKAVVFETLEEIEVDDQLNEIHLADWNSSQEILAVSTSGGSSTVSFTLAEPLEDVSVGSRGILVINKSGSEEGVPIEVTALDDVTVVVKLLQALTSTVKLGEARLLLQPEFISSPLLTGENTIEFDRDVSLKTGDRVAWKEGSAWKSAEVSVRQGRRVRLDLHGAPLPSTNEALYLMAASNRAEDHVIIPLQRGGGKHVWADDFRIVTDDLQDIRAGSKTIAEKLTDSSHRRAWYVYQDDATVGKVTRHSLSSLDFPGSPGDLASGQWILIHRSASTTPATITGLEEDEDLFTLKTSATGSLPSDARIYGAFAQEIRPAGYNQNDQPAVDPGSDADETDTLTLALSTLPEALLKGRRLIVRSHSEAELVTVKRAELITGQVQIVVDPRLQGTYPKNETTILGNVVLAGQGESQPTKILGSGDATQTEQAMVFETEEVAFTPDAAMPSGVAASMVVSVDGQIWQQTASLRDSEQEDPHYTVRLTEDGYLQLRFGDGFHGRRLPTGRNNVRVTARIGVGLAGNLAADSLVKPVKPHRLIDAVEQPLDASGGNDLEDAESLRENAPPTLLALDRAVSLSDFTALAVSNSGVWQAKAFARTTEFAHHETVQVAVVPAGGGLLGTLASTIEQFLLARALPGIRVNVVDYRPVILSIAATVQVKSSEFDPDDVVLEVEVALANALALKVRRLGAPLFRSEVFAVIESVTGVENCSCTLHVDSGLAEVRLGVGSDDNIRSIRVAHDQLLYLDPTLSTVDVEAVEFAL